MNTDQLSGKWKQMKGAAKQHWGKLTDDDLEVVAMDKKAGNKTDKPARCEEVEREKLTANPRVDQPTTPLPFDGARLIVGGIQTTVDASI